MAKSMQDGNTKDMIFNVPYLVSYLSKYIYPITGRFNPDRDTVRRGESAEAAALSSMHGDEVSVTIEGIGTLTNTCEIL